MIVFISTISKSFRLNIVLFLCCCFLCCFFFSPLYHYNAKMPNVFYLLHYYIRKMYISLQHSNIPMNNCFVFVIDCFGVKLWKHINIRIMFVCVFVKRYYKQKHMWITGGVIRWHVAFLPTVVCIKCSSVTFVVCCKCL